MTLNQIIALMNDTTFQGQVRAAMVSYANTVLNEVIPANAVVERKRVTLAEQIIVDGGQAILPRAVAVIASTPGFAAALNDTADQNDAAVQSAIISQFNVIAEVNAFDTAQSGVKITTN